MIRALSALLAASAALSAASPSVTLATAPLQTAPNARFVRVTILNAGPSVALSNGHFYATPASNSASPLPTSFDNCNSSVLATGWICSVTLTLPSPTTTVWFSITGTSATGLRGAVQITDINGNTLAVTDLR